MTLVFLENSGRHSFVFVGSCLLNNQQHLRTDTHVYSLGLECIQ